MKTEYTQVVPTVLAANREQLAELVAKMEGFTDYVQFDIMDGKFVPSSSIGYQDLLSLPTNLGWEAHLMVTNPENHIANFSKAGARMVIFHYEATPAPIEIIAQARHLGMKVGIALNPETPVSPILPLVNELDMVLFMTVSPGFYGSPFIPGVLDKIAELKHMAPQTVMGVDGGINEGNIGDIARAGVSVAYVGSAILLQPEPKASYNRLVRLAQDGSTGRAI
ncbi:ribulose-phosphate 3-epimerase [Chloroflexota bacterium]